MRIRVLAVAAALSAAGLAVPTSAAADPPPAAPGAFFHPVSPTRVLDTRDSSPVGDNGTITLDLSSAVPAGATAVVFNLTATDVTATTFITAWPHGTALPNASDLNVVAGDTRPNHVTVQLSPDHKVDLHNAHGSVDLIADLAGYYATGAGNGFITRDPLRVFDTRWQNTPVGPNSTVTVDLSQWVSAGATAVVFNLTATDATSSTYVTAWPDGSPRPSASSMNLAAGSVRPNLVTVAVPPSRKIDLYNHVGSVDLVVDFAGYYYPGVGDAFFPTDPDRLVDTRNNKPFGAMSSTNGYSLDFNPPLPPSADAAVLNMTGVNATDPTYLMAWPHFSAPPSEGSVLNLAPGEVAANQAVLRLDPQDQAVNVQNHVGTMDLVVDLAGYFAKVPFTCTTTCTYAWGGNTRGALGIGTSNAAVVSPQPAMAIAPAAIAGTADNSYYVGADGTLYSTGDDSDGQLARAPYSGGLIPIADLDLFSMVPAPVPSVSGVRAAASVVDTVEVLKSDGTVWGWGSDGSGQLGGSRTNYDPVQAKGFSGGVGLAMSTFDTFAVKSDGTVWGWGGSILLNGQRSWDNPVQVPGIAGATAVAASSFDAYALAGDGSVWAWGDNKYGQLGQGAAGNPAGTPVKVPGLTGVVALSSGGQDFEYALKSDGTVWGWGRDILGGNTYSATPVQVPGLSGITQIAAGDNFALALKSDGTVWSWGADDAGQLGGGSARTVPAQVPDLTGITRVSAGGTHAYAMKG
jgi:hypothetical protein